MTDVMDLLKRWQMDLRAVRERAYRAPTPRERERWHALGLLGRGWSAVQVAEAVERDPHPLGDGFGDFERMGPAGMAFEQTGGSPPPSTRSSRPS